MRKSQVSVFVLIALIIFILMGFLIFLDTSDNKETLPDIKKPNNDLIPLKENIDYCMQKQLRRALIIAGLKGGFIYEKGEYLIPSSIPEGIYDTDFISNMNLNWNNLLTKSLVHSQTEVYSPLLNDNLVLDDGRVIYNHSIVEDFEDFMFVEFAKCVDLETYEEEGFDLEYDKFYGKVTGYTPANNLFRVETLEGDVGDEVFIDLVGKKLDGHIIEIYDDYAIVQADQSGFTVDFELTDIYVINRNNTVNIDVIFEEDSVSSRLEFPITLNNNDNSIFFDDSYVTVNVRFSTLLKLSEYLLNEKYNNKAIDLTNETQFSNLVSNFDYMTNTDLTDIRLYRTVLNESDEEKKYVYSFIDEESKIMGYPYIFSFGYENHAPKIDLAALGNPILTDVNAIFMISTDFPVSYNLKPLTSDKQFIDNYLSYYVENFYSAPDATFSISSDGILNFEGYQEKKYSFDVSVTDGEAIRTHTFVFLTGLLDNENNGAANGCLEFYHNDIPNLYPVNEEFRRIYSYTSGDNHNLYAYYLYMEPTVASTMGFSSPGTLKFKDSCVYALLFDVKYEIKNKNTGAIINSGMGTEIAIPNAPYPLEITFTYIDRYSGNPSGTEPFVITLYPSSCLGPEDIPSTQQAIYGGTLSCCNTDVVRSTINANSPQPLVGSSVLKSSGIAMDAEAYFCLDMETMSSSAFGGFAFDTTSRVLWDDVQSDITSLFEGRIVSQCNGLSPVGTITSISGGSDYVSTASSVSSGSYAMPGGLTYPISLRKVTDASECEFCEIGPNSSDFKVLDDNGMVFYLGIKSLNTGSVGVIPTGSQYSSSYVLCEDPSIWFGSEDGSSWTTSAIGPSSSPSMMYKSRGFCYQGSNTCSGRVGSPGYEARNDHTPICTDYLFNGNSITSVGNTGWTCGSVPDACSTSCSCGTNCTTTCYYSATLYCSGGSCSNSQC